MKIILKRIGSAVAMLLSALIFLVLPARVLVAAEPEAAGFSWNQLTIDVPSTAGSGFDAYVRLLGRHIAQFLPGNPNVVIVNRPGAGGLTMTNYLYNSAAKDGTEIATSAASFMIDHLLRGEKSEARFDAIKFNWLGSMNKDTDVLLVSKASAITLQDLLGGKSANMGSTGTASNQWTFGRAMNSLVGTKINILPAYPGEAEILLAIERGELDGIPAIPVATLKALRPHWLKSDDVRILLQFAPTRMAEFPDTPNVLEIIKDADNREAMNAIILRGEIGRPFYAPPGVPEARVRILRKAFDAAMNSPDLKADSDRSNLAVDPLPGADVAEIVKRLNSPSEKVLKKLQGIFVD